MQKSSDIRMLPNSIVVALVSAYLLVVGSWLIVTRRIPAPPLLRILRAMAWKPYSGAISNVQPSAGFCFVARLPRLLLSDLESASSLMLYEDEIPLGPKRASYDDIRELGAGRFLHWGPLLYFSSSDNSDPRLNGRGYTVRELGRSTSLGIGKD